MRQLGTEQTEERELRLAVLDASVWISRLLPQDGNHEAAKQWIDSFLLNGGLLIVPSLFVLEVAASISRRTRNTTYAHDAADQISNMPHLQIAAMDAELVTEAKNVAADFGLRAGDSVYVALAKQLSLPIVSLDSELCKLAGAAGVRSMVPLQAQ